jgi:SAM-dependent methyltransferase
MRDLKKIILKNWLRYRDRWNRRIYNNIAIPFFGGLHPKNIFNYRSEFFMEKVRQKDIVIDVACGTGLILYKTAPFISKGYGIDISPWNIGICRDKHKHENLEYMEDDIFEIDYAELKKKTGFNVVILASILEHIEDVPSFLRGINSEKLLICVPSQENWEAQLKKHLGIRYMTDDTHFREYTRKMLSDEMKEAGYSVDFMGFNQEGEIICEALRK